MSVISVRNVLLNGQPGPKAGVIPTGRFNTPTIRARTATETVWKILVQSIDGAPTSAILTARFEAGIGTSFGNATPPAGVGVGVGGQYYWTDLHPTWQILDADQHAGLLPDGDFPTQLANQTLAAPVLYIKRVVGGFDHRLSINPFYSGGTSPAFQLSIEAEVRY